MRMSGGDTQDPDKEAISFPCRVGFFYAGAAILNVASFGKW